jgi:diguanylate cyclase (GGDEF)-like protein/PAS domain S-box-containing protein
LGQKRPFPAVTQSSATPERATSPAEDWPLSADNVIAGDDPVRAEELLVLQDRAPGDVTALSSPAGVFTYVSAASRATLGWEPQELVGRIDEQYVHPEELPAFLTCRDAALLSANPVTATFRFRCKDGGYLWTESLLRQVPHPRNNGRVLLMASIRDIANRKIVEATLQRQALTDPLTGISNRTVFMDRLGQALRRLERSATVIGVIYLDLDGFKVINDSLGHELGDRLLMKVAERTLAALRPTDTLARLGGDEFVVLSEGLTGIDDARRLAERVCESIEEPFVLGEESVICTASAGVATTADATHSARGLLQEADLALYRAKARGRNRAEVFDEELRTTAIGRLGVERMVRTAIDDRLLRVQYQPIVDLTTGHILDAEALVRIQGPEELIHPELFIDVAEESGLLVAVDGYVLDRAVEQVASWSRELATTDFLGVTVNVTARHLSDSHFGDVVAAALVDNDLPRGALSIEVTEQVLMEASNSALDCLHTIRDLGVRVGLDDFGTGYSSLGYLRQFPLDFVKIDRSFVEQLGAAPQTVAIVRAIIDLAHALHMWVVAEGVETEQQRATLVDLGCDRAQGYLFGHPAYPDAVSALINQRSLFSRVST